MYSPGPFSVCRAAVNCTLVNEYKLLGFVCSNARCKFRPFLSALLNRNMSQLESCQC